MSPAVVMLFYSQIQEICNSLKFVFQDFQMDVYFRQKWSDPRLAFTEQEAPVIIGPKALSNIWTPDLFFPNEKSADIHEVMLANQVMKVFPNGTVRYSSRSVKLRIKV